jgi:hypothetical protein
MTINVVSGIGWEGWVPVNPRVNTILTPDNLATVTAPGWISELDPAVFPQKIYPTDLWDIEYDYDPETGTQTYARFVTSIDINGIVTLSEPVSGGNVVFPVVNGNLAFFQGTAGMIADLGISPTNPALTKLASAVAGSYTVGNFLVANDTAGSIRAAIGVVPVQTVNTASATPSVNTAFFMTSLTANQITAGESHGFLGSMTLKGGSGGIAAGLFGSVTATQQISGTLEISAVKGQVDVTTSQINGAFVTGVLSNMSSPINESSLDTSNVSLFLGKNINTTLVGSILQSVGPATTAFNFSDNGTASFISAAGTGASIGPFSQWKVESNGVVGYILVSGIPYT